MYAVLENRSDQPPPEGPQPPQFSRTDAQLDTLGTAQQLSAAMEQLVDHEGPREEGEAAVFMSYRLCFNESELERKRLTSLVLADSQGGGQWRAYAELIRCVCVQQRVVQQRVVQ